MRTTQKLAESHFTKFIASMASTRKNVTSTTKKVATTCEMNFESLFKSQEFKNLEDEKNVWPTFRRKERIEFNGLGEIALHRKMDSGADIGSNALERLKSSEFWEI